MISPLRILLVLSFSALYASAQTVTLFDISESVPSQTIVEQQSFTISAGGTNADGGTTYIEVNAITSEVILEGSTTVTVLSEPITVTDTFVADASGFAGTLVVPPGSGVAQETCGFGSDGVGTCVLSVMESGIGIGTTVSGSVVPIFTLTAPGSQSSGAASQGGSGSQSGVSQSGAGSQSGGVSPSPTQSGAVLNSASAGWIVQVIVVIAVLHALLM
ncbi:hypothetical protein MSAN_01973700 [Mycena sanguinolenta]|uniref:Uncharacterized protein n=1 Tax=Mycena sanguinolenta TaxID=230812 RepID=A0A8H6XM23_9AGAR|nr:hypothetical protein MSAN_01973700 [Mycena sanguinolenta]